MKKNTKQVRDMWPLSSPILNQNVPLISLQPLIPPILMLLRHT